MDLVVNEPHADDQPHYREHLRAALAAGEVSPARLDDMVRRILRSLFAKGEQDALVAAVAAANPRTVVVLETGGPVLFRGRPSGDRSTTFVLVDDSPE